MRVKQRAMESLDPSNTAREWDSLRKDITALLLAWSRPVTVSMRDVGSTSKSRNLRLSSKHEQTDGDSAFIQHISRLLAQASFIPSVDTSSWVSASGSTSTFSIRGGISLDPAPTKNIQFISLGIHPLKNRDGRNVLWEEVNRCFANSSFGKVEEAPELDDVERRRRAEDRRYKSDGFTSKELKSSSKGVDRWPMFYIKIEMREQIPDQEVIDNLLGDERALSSVLRLLTAVVGEFLKLNHFGPKHIHSVRSPLKRKFASEVLDKEGFDHLDLPSRHNLTRTESSPHLSTSSKISRRSDNANLHATNLAVPSVRPASPFAVWPRVKSGQVPSLPLKAQPPIIKNGIAEDLLCTPRRRNCDSPNLENGDKDRSTKERIISQSGLVTRVPFLDVSSNSCRRKGSPDNETDDLEESVPESEEAEIAKDDVIIWTDPVTRKQCHINKRTGLTQQLRKPPLSTARCNSTLNNSTRLSSFPLKPNSTLSGPSRPASPFVDAVLKSWNNPVFLPIEPSIPVAITSADDADSNSILRGYRHDCSQSDIDRAFKGCAVGASGRISKSGLRQAEVISQVDKKFILIKIPEVGGKSLVLVDQHAADERVQIEKLMEDYCTPDDGKGLSVQGVLKAGVRTVKLEPSIKFDVSRLEGEKLEIHRQHFADWGILLAVPTNPVSGEAMCQLVVTALPPGIMERCRLDPKALIELIRAELWDWDAKAGRSNTPREDTLVLDSNHDGKHGWLIGIHNCPRGILDLLNSRSCRSAVMFNDALTKEECETLITRLAMCKFPFMCAHGRPSMVPLVEIGSTGAALGAIGIEGKEKDEGFGRAFMNWKRNLT